MTLLRGAAFPADPDNRVPPGSRAVPVPAVLGDLPAAVLRSQRAARVLDVLLAGLALLVLWPLMVVLAVLVRCTSRGPALFRQTRLGQGGAPFVMLKFRTMHADADDRLHRDYIRRLLEEPTVACGPAGLYKLVDDPRVTPLGRWLRRTSLDELPQLLNVLRGDMALVGPRPVLPWEATLFPPCYHRRFLVRPGITGLWQTSGRNRLTMLEALDLDLVYVETRSLRRDLGILARTLPAILTLEGAR